MLWSHNWSDNQVRQSPHEYAQEIGNIFLTTDHDTGEFQRISAPSHIPFHERVSVQVWTIQAWASQVELDHVCISQVSPRHHVIYHQVRYQPVSSHQVRYQPVSSHQVRYQPVSSHPTIVCQVRTCQVRYPHVRYSPV